MKSKPELSKLIVILISCFSALLVLHCRTSDPPVTFQLHPDFEIQLVASEPIIFDPVDLEFDHYGSAYVLQMPGYPEGTEQSSIVRLVDNDEDGIFDRQQLFATDLRQASSLMPYDGGFLVAAPPDLLFLKDTDDDGSADVRTVLMSGFTDANLQHNFNGITYGIDGWIYFANGGNGGSTHWADSPDSIIRIGASDFRIHLDKHLFELFGRSSGGYEIAMDTWGNLFGTHNLYHIRNLVFPLYYITGLPLDNRELLVNISDHEENGLSRIYPIGEQETRVNHPEQSGYFSGACGITHYGGGSFSSTYAGNIFVNDVVLNLVHRDVISKNGTTFVASRGRSGVDFLASSDRSFRPVNSSVGPDGALYIVDMHRKVIEHPEWIPDELEKDMDLNAGRDQGRIYRITEKGKTTGKLTFEGKTTVQLVELLNHPNQWQRLTAQRLLTEQRDVASILLLRNALHENPEGINQIHILHTLYNLGDDISDLLYKLLSANNNVQVLQHVLRLSEPYLPEHADLSQAVFELAGHRDLRIKMQLALTLSTFPVEMQERLGEKYLEKLIEIAEDEGVKDPFVRMALCAAGKDQPLGLCRLILEKDMLSEDEGIQELIMNLASIIARWGDSKEQLKMLELFSKDKEAHNRAMIRILEKYRDSDLQVNDMSARRSWQQELALLERKGNIEIIGAAWKLRKKLNLAPSNTAKKTLSYAINEIEKENSSVHDVTSLIYLLTYAEPELVVDPLLSRLDARQPMAVQQAAISVLEGFQDKEITKKIVDHWPSLSPAVRRKVADMLIYTPENHDLLFTSLENGTLNLSEFNFDLERRRRLLNSKDSITARRARALFSDAGVVQRKEAIESMRAAIKLKGDADKGKKVFITQCASCHRYADTGNQVGPDLTEISRKSKETLLHDILDPNAGADPEYINHIVDTQEGETSRVYSGIIGDETDDEILLIMMGGEEKSIPKRTIKKLQSTGLSLMPEGFEGTISTTEMADLLAFLQQPVL